MPSKFLNLASWWHQKRPWSSTYIPFFIIFGPTSLASLASLLIRIPWERRLGCLGIAPRSVPSLATGPTAIFVQILPLQLVSLYVAAPFLLVKAWQSIYLSLFLLKVFYFEIRGQKPIKGTVSWDFLYPVFFINQFILVPLEMSMGCFTFFCFFIELLHF